MYQYSYDSSESSDNETHDSSNPIKTLDFSESFQTSQDAVEQLENLSKSSEERNEPVETLFLLQNELNIVPDNVSKFIHLKTLDLSNNHISSLPNSILQLPLNALLVKNNRLTDSGIPKSLKQLRTLKVCNLSGNCLTKFPQQLAEIRSLEYLYLGNNSIFELPREIETLQRLRVLCLGGNRLSEIPSSVGNLINLRGLILSDNALETLPTTIANLKNLKSLLLHKNRLRTLPTEIVGLRCLTELSLRENPLVVSFVNDMLHNPPSLLELAGRAIKLYNIETSESDLPRSLQDYLRSAHRCVNPKCKGVFFDNRVEHIKFIDFCGKYRVPLLQFLCSSKCVVNNSALHGSFADSNMLRKVLLG